MGSQDEEHAKKIPKASLKRRHSPGKENEPGEDLVGCRVRVCWPMDRMFYNAVIDSFDSARKKHKVMYDDGDEELLNLEKEMWQFIEDESDSYGEPNPGNQRVSPQNLAESYKMMSLIRNLQL